ncbi:hypothetical protein CIPAW_14G010000 [Carya illinoinensis]|uniref:Endonuclease/exonuclease/phosphatase domain-containing protein n=1 Tax=Carya illinoinensis TaxID=32201 RepID=A0A8T1N9N0_CARIL|nr:hypothetical protein CIPAW_14G010000 [Carya illinoinensis]
MKPKVISWNVRELNEYNKRLQVRNLLRQWKGNIICLQETKLEFITRKIVRSLWRGHHVGWLYLPSKGASGGVLIMFDKRVVDRLEDCVGEFTVAFSFENGFQWAFAGVYGPNIFFVIEVYNPNIDAEIRILWEELARLLSWWELPSCIGGDFNVSRFPSERSSMSHITPTMRGFSDFISKQALMDIPLTGGSYSWSNTREIPS